MKNKLSFLFILTSIFIYSQDVITKKNGDVIQAKVLNISNTELVYEKFENKSGPSFTILKNEIYKIKYANGTEDIIGSFASLDEAKNYITSRINEYGTYRESNNEKVNAYFEDNILVLKNIKYKGKRRIAEDEKWDLSTITKIHNLSIRDGNIAFINVVCYQIKPEGSEIKKLVIKFTDQKAAQEVIDALREFAIMLKK